MAASEQTKSGAPAEVASLPITVEFSGGLEMLFANERVHRMEVPLKTAAGDRPNINWLIDYLCKNKMKDPRKDLFVLDDTVRPGILVLINDSDWSLEGEGEYEIQAKDHIMFISTLHGG
ncbi:uncharacterized protein PV09_08162 [Verruconis gallopava]|uniref:Ubiquitin-related modifier 1 n=1 Tax=Verruconis gallopava TaxID=253628 RepID=A0A0D1YHF2_9PEZI|nr:uncharacterized protein PV09_08162 [Verruconis gallopava]KIW00272.1 hypothetical protein PV09_08162 [Verruconis gallopava]